ncbi:hypothetical protein GGD81_000846 [Rhodobium orientis]|uniref:flagellar protein FlgN n=1 Tax=Rhodobium orientis TaxID=34017 RepID=UPI0011B93773|nr:flagellar protein FlgN [Rhodobium orientis]MBB4301829.1 hypothetical protein [Rhodobium orientis]
MTPPLFNPVAIQSAEEPLIGSAEAAEELCGRLNATMDELLAAIDAETKLVRAGKLIEASDFQPNKSELAKVYVADIEQFKRNALALSRLAPASITALKERHEEFRSLLQINLAVLATAREVSQDIIRNVARQTSAGPAATTYGRSGTMAKEKIVGERGIAVDRNL